MSGLWGYPQLIGDAGGIEQLVAALSVYEDEVLIRPQGQLALFYLAEHEALYAAHAPLFCSSKQTTTIELFIHFVSYNFHCLYIL